MYASLDILKCEKKLRQVLPRHRMIVLALQIFDMFPPTATPRSQFVRRQSMSGRLETNYQAQER